MDYERASAFEEQLERNKEYRARTAEQQKFAEEHPFRAALSTIPANAVQGWEYFGSLLSNWGHNDPDDPDSYRPLDVTQMYATNFVRNVRGTVAKKIEEDPAFQGVEIGGQNIYSFLYQTGMSMGDFLFNSFLTGNFTGGLGGTGSEAAKKAAENLSLAIMGSGAAANTTVEAIERGLSNRQAYALGAVAGAAEIFTERFSLEALLDGSWEKNAVQYVLKNAFTEGSEEVGSDLINLLADVLVARDQSEWRQSVEAYRQQGLSKEEAFTGAMKDQAVSMGMDFLGGALSGGFMSGSNVAVNGANVQTETLVSDEAADKLLNDRTSVAFLKKHGNLNLQKGMPQEQKRAAVRQAVENVVHKEKAASGEGDGETHYSLKAFGNGRRFVDVDTDQEQFDGLSLREMGKLATKVIKERFAGKVIGLDNQAFVKSRTATEYGFPAKKLGDDEHRAKMRASTELDNLMDAGTNFRTEPDGMDGHTHSEATGDFRYFDTVFKVGKEYYSGVINIMPTENGLVIKDITKIRNITQDIRGSYGEKPQATFLRDASMNSIPQKAQKGNKKVSTAGVDVRGQEQPTHPLTPADAKRFATETGTENGLILDDYVQKQVRPETAERLNTLAKALGVRVRFVSKIRGGTANASIQGNEVKIERYNPNPVTFLLGHELTHRMQSLSPEAYARFKEAVRSEAEKEAQGLYTLYQNRGEKINFEGAMDEATANYAGRLLEKGPVLDEFIQRHKTDRSLLEKVLDAVRDILSKLTGQERKQAETAEGKLLEALEETAERVKEKTPGKNELTLSAGTDTLKNDLEVLEKRIKPTMTAQVEALPEEQKQALQDYTGFAATRINSAIRYGRITPEIQKKIDLLDTALKDGVMPETVVLHRDTSFAFIAQEIGLSGKPTAEELMRIVGWPVTNRIFTSTSFENLGLLGRDTEIWLTVPAGYRGCQFIQSVARPQFKNQVEVLFARGLRYKITDAKIENGKYILFAEVLQ